jgi:hypothetical protein
MGWQDRNYNTGNSGPGANYLGNPLALLGFSVPFGTWFGARVRLHFWLLLSFLFTYIESLTNPAIATIWCALTLIALIAHEFGHRICARFVHGSHDEFMLWPAGGMIPPNAPPFPGAYFFAHVGGILANLLLAILSAAAIYLITYNPARIPWNPLAFLFGPPNVHLTPAIAVLELLFMFTTINLGIILINLLPYYWFDGGPLLQAILWPFLKLHNAVNVTCIVGMILAVPMFAFALLRLDLIMMIIWALLFASSYTKRQQLKTVGTQEFEEAIAWSANYSDSDHHRPHKKTSRRWIKAAKKRAAAEQHEQAQIDAILAKVKEKGLHSLSWWEKRALKKATERQRQRDLAERR